MTRRDAFYLEPIDEGNVMGESQGARVNDC